jgi:hypothetical protein
MEVLAIIKEMRNLCSVTFALGVLPIAPVLARKAPGKYPACDVDNPPAKCADNMYVEIVAALAPNTGRLVDTSQPGCGAGNTKSLVKQALNAMTTSSSKDSLKSFSSDLFSLVLETVSDDIIRNTGGAVNDFLQINAAKKKMRVAYLLQH